MRGRLPLNSSQLFAGFSPVRDDGIAPPDARHHLNAGIAAPLVSLLEDIAMLRSLPRRRALAVAGFLAVANVSLAGENAPAIGGDGPEDKPAVTGTAEVVQSGEAAVEADPRSGDKDFERARQLMRAIQDVLGEAADKRGSLKSLPKTSDFVVPPLWTETREDREARVKALLDSALSIVTDVPVVDTQKTIDAHRRTIRDLEDQIARLKEKQLMAPKEALLPGVLTDTVDSLDAGIQDLQARVGRNRDGIAAAKSQVSSALKASGVELSQEQVDLLLDGVLSGDLVRLVATFDAAKLVDAQLSRLVEAAGDNTAAARKYFAMHAALFAMLVHAQDMAIGKIDTQYLPRLDAVMKDLANARTRTMELLRADNRPDQQRILEANRESQQVAEEAAKAYRRYLLQQRDQIVRARQKAAHDLKIADNTFETVQASFELNNLMRDGTASFEALQKLEAPTFEQIFRNDDLRREFEALTRKLDQPAS
jgi:hypothetical protein